ncbi:maleylpyruvate isomerase family mycothiol-dependent enzyme [uncultured Tessaracoccus sp.]|uniref:maleylpyruvate isomerase family mycothiol-dependent enzyme n=1 Tax=uncultured Tessaracoccus sp. TaxID=905023 RepID=UPI00261B842C|nr:maleylpyruvate isomerase family mycothiol-dependent enzyme [uncultured Tessaracoccus sp.]
MTFARRQRRQLLDVMRTAGPLAPTACEGWLVQDLAAHLWVREHRPSALPGIGVSRFAAHTDRLQMEGLHRLGFEGLLEKLERPGWVMRLVDPLVNGAEFYLHLEDVLRPRGERAELSSSDQEYLRKIALLLARKTQLGKPYRLVVTPTDGHTKSFGSGEQVVYVEGAPNELLLHFSGRDADVAITTDDEPAYRASIAGL